MSNAEKSADLLRTYVPSAAVGLALLVLAAFGIRWIATNRSAPVQRNAMQFTRVHLTPQPPEPRPVPPPPRPVVQPKVVEEAPTNRVELKPVDFTPPDAPRPPSDAPPGGGRLSLAAEGEGPGDAFNLVGNPGGRGLLSGGGLGDGTGDGQGDLGDESARRFGWYYAKIANEIEDVFRRKKKLSTASTRVELRLWADPSGHVSRVQLIRSTGNPELDEAIQSIVGTRLKEPPPRDIPMPMVARFTARRPQ
jgi:protein TonB